MNPCTSWNISHRHFDRKFTFIDNDKTTKRNSTETAFIVLEILPFLFSNDASVTVKTCFQVSNLPAESPDMTSVVPFNQPPHWLDCINQSSWTYLRHPEQLNVIITGFLLLLILCANKRDMKLIGVLWNKYISFSACRYIRMTMPSTKRMLAKQQYHDIMISYALRLVSCWGSTYIGTRRRFTSVSLDGDSFGGNFCLSYRGLFVCCQ